MPRVRTIGRRGLALALGVGLAGVFAFESGADDRDGRPPARLVAQKPAAKKKGAPAKKGTDAKADGDGMMADAKADGATAKGDAAATGALSFKRDIAPLLVANCVGCHTGTGPGLARGKLSMASFEKLMAGGKRGQDIEPGDPGASRLVAMIQGEKFEGESLPKMPPNNGQMGFSEAAQEKVAAWIKSGARLDAGVSATDPLTKYAATVGDLRRDELAKMKPEERDKVTTQAGLDRWKKATATVPDVTPGQHFLGFGNLPGDRMAKLLKAMEPQYALANRLLGTGQKPALDPNEKISLYVFKDRNAFTEFVRSVENQEVEPGETARAKLNAESPYLVAVDPVGGAEETAAASAKKSARGRGKKGSDSSGGPERSLLGLFTEQLVVGAANKAGKAPKWVALGLGAYAASQVEGNSPYYRRLRDETLSELQVGWKPKATEVLGGLAPADSTRAVGFGLFEWIAANAPGRPMTAFIQVMLEGQDKLDEAINGCLGVNREQFLLGSSGWLAERYGH